MSFFKKPNRPFRGRVVREEEDEKEERSEGDLNIDKLTSSKENSIKLDDEEKPVKESKPPPKFSFGDEEEEVNVFQVKKSAYSRKIAKQLRKEKKKREKETKDENQVNDVNSAANIKKDDCTEENPIEISVPDFDDSDNYYGSSLDPTSTRDIPIHQFKKVLEKGVIPDAKLIYAMKKQRQMAKNIDEFISIEAETAKDVRMQKLKNLRLRYSGNQAEEKSDDEMDLANTRDDNDDEDDEDDEIDEDDQRMDFAADKEAIEREKMRENFILVQDEDQNNIRGCSGNSDDELERWEEEQIRKGVGLQSGSQLLDHDHGGAKESFYSSRRKHQIPSYLLRRRTFMTKEEIMRKISELIAHKKIGLESLERELIHIKNEIEKSVKISRSSEEELPVLKEKYESLKKQLDEKIKQENG